MSDDLDDDLFLASEPAEVEAEQPAESAKAVAADWMNLFTAVLIGALLCFFGMRFLPDGGGRSDGDGGDRQERVEPVSGGFLVFVSDRQNVTLEQDLLMREMDAFGAAHKLERFRWVDDTDEPGQKMIEYAASKKVSPPLVALVHEGQIKRVAAWPSGEVPEAKAKLEKFLR